MLPVEPYLVCRVVLALACYWHILSLVTSEWFRFEHVKSWRPSCGKNFARVTGEAGYFCVSMLAQFVFFFPFGRPMFVTRKSARSWYPAGAFPFHWIIFTFSSLSFFLPVVFFSFGDDRGAKFDDETISSTLSLFSSKELRHINVQIFKGWLWVRMRSISESA